MNFSAKTMWLLVFIMAFASSASASSQPAYFPDRYDQQIKEAAQAWWPAGPDWMWWKAQLWQESRLDPNATSPVGATGLAQFMGPAWAEVSRELKWGLVDRRTAKLAITGGAYYMAKLKRQWTAPRPAMDRHKLAQASYNAGLGSLLKAQRACGGVALYHEIIACLPQVTGRHSAETITYVERIERWRGMMQ